MDKKYKKVFILGPSHTVYFDKISIPDCDYIETPLGKVAIDKKIRDELLKNNLFTSLPQVHKNEHSVQIQIPFLQVSLKDFKLIPLVAGDLTKEQIQKAAEILKKYLDDDTLFIASSDFTHYGYSYGYLPFKTNIEENLKKLDFGAYNYIEKKDVDGFLLYKEKTKDTICGYIPIAIILEILPKDTEAKLLKYNTSGNIVSDFTNSVSYFSIGFFKKKDDPPDSYTLTSEEKKSLLTLSRKVLENYIKNKKTITAEEAGIKLTENLKQPRGAFVTLQINHNLRGCIGEIFPRRPLYQVVIDHTIDAAVNDPRFPPVREEELNKIKIEISVLTPPKEVPSYKDIVIGRDGVYLIKGFHSAVFLPQVAPEQGWDLETTLNHLCLKAGLPFNAWRENTRFLTFQAIVFSKE
jgi:hypothetical protein